MKKLDLKKLESNINKIAEFDFDNKKCFGTAYYVYQDGNLELERCYGHLSVDGEIPVTDKTLFRLASMTKPITAVATLILVERGLLNLDDPICKYLPEFATVHIIDEKGQDLGLPKKQPTIRNLLTHTSGIGSLPEKIEKLTDNDRKDIDSTLRFFLNAGLDFEPSEAEMYSGTAAFDVLVKIIEIVSQTDYLSFLTKEIFEPCGMIDTTFVPDSEQTSRLIEMHTREGGENAVFKMREGSIFEEYPSSHYLGGAGLASTLCDYGRFAKMLLENGMTDKGRLVSEASIKEMSTPQFPVHQLESWGLGVRVIIDGTLSALPKGCFGWSGAYGSHFWIDPENGITAVYMKNSKVDGGAANESARNFEKAVYGSFED
ncbi:MAG: beta-lactamase family protein [Clostridia bacterium]|nr:beta-lactamase family protein [Clostridia bacterium]